MGLRDVVREYRSMKNALYRESVNSGLSYSVMRRILEDALREDLHKERRA